ncbi:MAG: hypothetical protein SFU27_00650 [Thermonemataceae bacterium]|nr:hypothetical protein [Thermonemataceae bacterium]
MKNLIFIVVFIFLFADLSVQAQRKKEVKKESKQEIVEEKKIASIITEQQADERKDILLISTDGSIYNPFIAKITQQTGQMAVITDSELLANKAKQPQKNKKIGKFIATSVLAIGLLVLLLSL